MDPTTASNPYVAGAGAISQILGTGIQAYGTYEQSQQAQKQYELAVKAWQDERDRQARQDEAQRQQQILDNITAGGNYSQGIVKNAQNAYGTYARQTGM